MDFLSQFDNLLFFIFIIREEEEKRRCSHCNAHKVHFLPRLPGCKEVKGSHWSRHVSPAMTIRRAGSHCIPTTVARRPRPLIVPMRKLRLREGKVIDSFAPIHTRLCMAEPGLCLLHTSGLPGFPRQPFACFLLISCCITSIKFSLFLFFSLLLWKLYILSLFCIGCQFISTFWGRPSFSFCCIVTCCLYKVI